MSASRTSSTSARRGRYAYNRSGLRTFFYDYPEKWYGDDRTGPQYYGAPSAGKTKVYCKFCYDINMARKVADENKRASDRPDAYVRRSDEILEREMWDDEANVRSSHTDTIANHLMACPNVDQQAAPEIMRLISEKEATSKRAPRSPRRTSSSRAPSYSMAPPSALPLPTSFPPTPVASAFANASHLAPFSHQRSPSPFPSSASSFAGQSSDIYPGDSISAAGSATGQPSPVDTPPLSRTHSRSRLSRRSSTQITLDIPPAPWSDDREALFERQLARLTAAAGFPLSWVDNPEWISFCDLFLPGAPVVSRKTLTKRILPETVGQLRQVVRGRARNRNVTLQADGWTGTNNHHLVAFMVTMDHKVYTVSVKDTTSDRKTAENFVVLLEDVKNDLVDNWNARLVAVVTDASGESRKARRLFGVRYPRLIVLDCYAHQVNLIVGDLFKSRSSLLHYSSLASDVIAWLRSKTRILVHLPFSVIRPVLTRWTAHYMSFRRLLQLYSALLGLIHNDNTRPEQDRVMVQGDTAARQKAEQMVKILKDNAFWHNIALLCRYLEPLAIAANITQQSFCRLDEVLIAFGFLLYTYTREDMADNEVARDAVVSSLERRWAKADQSVFVAAVLVNPLYRTSPFRAITRFNLAHINDLFTRLWHRFFPDDAVPFDFLEQAAEFLDGTGMFEHLNVEVEREIVRAMNEHRQPDPMRIIRSFRMPGRQDSQTPFIRFAEHLLSVSANSASCERLFSTFGNILTKLRNRTGNSVLQDLSELKMHIRDEHTQNGAKSRLKRRFQIPDRTKRGQPRNTQVTVERGGVQRQSIQEILAAAGYDTIPAAHAAPSTTSEDPATGAPATRRQSEFSAMISQHIDSVEEDDSDNEPVRESEGWELISLSDLFDFSAPAWVIRFKQFKQLSFDDELALYEFLEMDAEAEDDPDADALTQDVLMNGEVDEGDRGNTTMALD